MAAAMDEAVVATQRAAAAVDPVMRAIRPEQLSLPTPCHEWDLRQLLDHLFGTLHNWAARVEDRQPADWSAPPLETAGDDVVQAWIEARDDVLDAISQPGALDREIALPMGSRGPARRLAAIMPVETLLHGWDAARSIGHGTEFDPELAEALTARGRALMKDRPRGPAFAEERTAPEDATAADRMAAFYGREV